ncbi:MAG: N-acetyl-gamma-glutamyl-phosphate reductase [Marivibrio sp.]|uniref:N-acetyl-gamma-glutamyl-phosphate reductase n=1 Tax=Marivibrio sp. TaxID=2039719 RepID=UPI0032ED9F20
MTATIFIDGEAGTTGLQIRSRLQGRDDLRLISLGDAERKDVERRRARLNEADIAILCLPDDASREAVAMIETDHVRVIDASSAHRTAEGWIYGFPEFAPQQRDEIARARFVTNPGCYAITSVAMLHPLTQAGLIPSDHPVTINAVSGYSGGGKGLIAAFEDETAETYTTEAFRLYGLGLNHKHVPEIRRWAGLDRAPLFVPSVGRYRQGMLVSLPLQLDALPGAPTPDALYDALAARYGDEGYVEVLGPAETAEIATLDPESLNGTNKLRLHVFANEAARQALVVGLIDNLGKGASGQALQNLNIMLGAPEGRGLDAPLLL